MKQPLEKEIQLAICDYLALKKYFFWRQNTTPVFDPTKQVFRAMPKYAIKGVPDIILVKDGEVVFIEVKRKGGVLSEHQVFFQEQCAKRNVQYHVVTCIDDVIAIGL